MRIALIAPWFRTLGQVYGRALSQQGHDVLLVTTDGHFQAGYGWVPELLLPARLKAREGPKAWMAARRRLRAWRPDAVLQDQTWDVRLAALGRGAPRALVVHDAAPHDSLHVPPAWQRAVVGRQRRASRDVVCFSRAVATRLTADVHARTHVVPLTSELPEDLVGPVATARERRDFLVLGRISPYKNVETVFAAWAAHVGSPAYRGDELVLLGDGHLEAALPPATRWERRRFDFRAEAAGLHRFKASINLYAEASQSGAQLTSMQLGVMPISSTAGGLPEYQPLERGCIPALDVGGVVRSLGELADPGLAEREGRAARQHYATHFRDDVAAAALSAVCVALTSDPRVSGR
jgi:glycosyltransferase involved in cell wall biosynthesis